MDSWDYFADDIIEKLIEMGIIDERDADSVGEVIIDALTRWEGDI